MKEILSVEIHCFVALSPENTEAIKTIEADLKRTMQGDSETLVVCIMGLKNDGGRGH